MPTAPANRAAPTNAAAPGITAPIKARTVPTAVIPTVASSAEEKLCLLKIRRGGQGREPIDWHRAGLAHDTNKANQHRADIDRRSHDCLLSDCSPARDEQPGDVLFVPTYRRESNAYRQAMKWRGAPATNLISRLSEGHCSGKARPGRAAPATEPSKYLSRQSLAELEFANVIFVHTSDSTMRRSNCCLGPPGLTHGR